MLLLLCFHSQHDCNAVLEEFDDGALNFIGEHAPGCYQKNGKDDVSNSISPLLFNFNDAMKQWVKQHATHQDHLHDPTEVVWSDCIAHFTELVSPNINSLDKTQLNNLVYHTFEHIFGSNAVQG